MKYSYQFETSGRDVLHKCARWFPSIAEAMDNAHENAGKYPAAKYIAVRINDGGAERVAATILEIKERMN